VLLPAETPDGRWHLFANRMPPKLVHYTSEDGVRWSRVGTLCRGGMRAFVRRDGDRFLLLYEEVRWPAPLRSRIVLRTSTDLERWSVPMELLRPCLPWHGGFHRTCGNPCLTPWRGEWLLHYSAGVVFLKDCGFFEPRFVGLATAAAPEGPWTALPEPFLRPHPDDPLRRLGAGALRVLPDSAAGVLWGFNNGITRDAEGRSRSAITLLASPDGRGWTSAADAPVLAPGGPPWKRALVYALDVRRLPDGTTLHLYFNARDGWARGRERIGLAVGRPEETR
jgi:hypothetical protein